MSRKTHNFKTIEGIIKRFGLSSVIAFTRQYYGIPRDYTLTTCLFTDYCWREWYGGMKLAEKIIEWVNEGELVAE